MKVFITGATGYIGGSVAEGLVASEKQVMQAVMELRQTVS